MNKCFLLMCYSAASVTFVACGERQVAVPMPMEGPLTTRHPDLVLVTLDTTRADRLGAYGYEQGQTPWLDDLAKRGITFEQAYSSIPLTIPSHATMFTGLYPYRLGIRSNGDNLLQDEFYSMAEIFHDQGYQTAASVAAFVTTRVWGFSQGFDWYRDALGQVQADTWHQERTADKVLDDCEDILQRVDPDEPLFLWAHFYDPHYPYAPPEEYRAEFGQHPYDGELAFVDTQLRRLEQAFQRLGRDPVWVVVGDHGEALGEHRETTHGLFVYQGTQHVPLIMGGPGIEQSVVTQPVGLVDLLPTILQLLDLPVPEGLDGKAQPGQPHPIYMESYQPTERFRYAPHLGVLWDGMKLISKPRPELYRISVDPREQENLVQQLPGKRAELESILRDFGATPPGHKAVSMDPDTLAKLESLGYVVSGEPYDGVFENLDDPQDHGDVIVRIQRADFLCNKGKREEAISLLQQVLVLEPRLLRPYLKLARLASSDGKPQMAWSTIEKAMRRFPSEPQLLLAAANIRGQMGDHGGSLDYARKALESQPDNVQAASTIAKALANLGRVEDLREFGDRFLDGHPDATAVAAVLGTTLFKRGEFVRAERLLRRAAKEKHPMVGVLTILATMSEAVGRHDEAESLVRRELGNFPGNQEARRLLARILGEKGDEEASLAELDQLLEDLPHDPVLMHDRALSLYNLGRNEEALAALNQALLEHPRHPMLRMLKANVLATLGRMEEATALKDSVLEMSQQGSAQGGPGVGKPSAGAGAD